MNAVGQLGELIIEYQYFIEVGLLAVLALIVVIALITAICKSISRKKLIKTIDGKVDDLNAAVTDINAQVAAIIDKQNQLLEKGAAAQEAVNRPVEPEKKEEPEKPVELEKDIQAEKPAETEKKVEAEKTAESEQEEAGKPVAPGKEALRRSWLDDHDWQSQDRGTETSGRGKFVLAEELKALDQRWIESEGVMRETGREPARRYYSTDCAVDKHGNVYTEEELKKQIY